jgi:hypothetical protein
MPSGGSKFKVAAAGVPVVATFSNKYRAQALDVLSSSPKVEAVVI